MVSPKFDRARRLKDTLLLWEVAAQTDSRIEPIPCGEKQWADDASAVLEMARREGERIEAFTMVIAYHAIFSTYGFWLPNDPRGSWSEFVGSWELAYFGRATKTDARHSVAGVRHDRSLRMAAKAAMRHPPVVLSGRQALAAGRGFARACRESGYVVYACSILPEHVHTVVARHERDVERIVGHLKGRATQRLKTEGLRPDNAATVWAQGCWRVYLNTAEDVKRAIAYVEANPEKEGKPRQRWSFVTPYKG